MTQKERLIHLLNENEYVCSSTFHANYIAEFRSLISALNKYEGYNITGEPCLGKCGVKHTSKGLKRWRMETRGLKMDYMVKDEIRKEFCCMANWNAPNSHAPNCYKIKEKPKEKINQLF